VSVFSVEGGHDHVWVLRCHYLDCVLYSHLLDLCCCIRRVFPINFWQIEALNTHCITDFFSDHRMCTWGDYLATFVFLDWNFCLFVSFVWHKLALHFSGSTYSMYLPQNGELYL